MSSLRRGPAKFTRRKCTRTSGGMGRFSRSRRYYFDVFLKIPKAARCVAAIFATGQLQFESNLFLNFIGALEPIDFPFFNLAPDDRIYIECT